MKTKHLPPGCLTLIATLFAGFSLQAAPLAWFPGPPIIVANSGAAAVTNSGLGIVLVGGSSYYYPENLVVTNQRWTVLAGFTNGLIAGGAVAGGDYIYYYGGTDGTTVTSAVAGYSPSGDGNLTLAPMSVARAYLGYAPDSSGNAYAIGGIDDTGQPLASVESYHIDSSNWMAVASMPVARYNFPAVFDHTNQIYIFGGYTNSTTPTETTDVLRYSTKTKTWSVLPSMPVATAGSCAAIGVDGQIYVVGGLSGGVATNIVQVYSPASNSWVISAPLLGALSGSSMSVDNLGRLVVIGGADTNGLDVTNVWRSQQFSAPDVAPVFTNFPGSNATYLVQYSSSINASGNPPATYYLVNGPDGMQVDYYSGAITWTPQSDDIGSNVVTIRASNYVGTVDWNYSIFVPNPPPINPTNLVVVSTTDTSVTLAWDPEPPVVGAVTYSAYLRSVTDGSRGGGTVHYSQIGTNTTVPEIIITGLTPGKSQAYYIAVKGPGGSSGTNSNISAVTTAPQGPTNLVVTGLTSTSVSLAWDPSPGPEQNPGFSSIVSYTLMKRVIPSYAGYTAALTNITGTSVTITGLPPGLSNIWYVSGVDVQGYASGLVGTNYVVVVNPVPAPPQLSGALAVGDGTFQFTGTFGSSGPQTVLVEATSDPTDPNSWVQIGSLTPASSPFSFTDTNAAQFPVRYYRVIAP
jgi:N-acetylneuraminic acid mutarotase